MDIIYFNWKIKNKYLKIKYKKVKCKRKEDKSLRHVKLKRKILGKESETPKKKNIKEYEEVKFKAYIKNKNWKMEKWFLNTLKKRNRRREKNN